VRSGVFWGVLRHVALVRTDVSEELSASIRVTRIGEVGTTLTVTTSSNRRTLRRNTKSLSSSETSFFTIATRRNIPEDAILHGHRRDNLKSYVSGELGGLVSLPAGKEPLGTRRTGGWVGSRAGLDALIPAGIEPRPSSP
jgi:hypothetical protein